jgi:hypothetical protein
MSSKVCIPTPVVQPRDICIHSVSTLGHLGKFTLSLHWMNLGNQPVEILIEDVYLLVTPSPQGEEDPEDEANRAHAAKMERLENAELLHMRSQSEIVTGSCPLLSLCPIMSSFRRWFHHPGGSLPVASGLSVICSISCLHYYLIYPLALQRTPKNHRVS